MRDGLDLLHLGLGVLHLTENDGQLLVLICHGEIVLDIVLAVQPPERRQETAIHAAHELVAVADGEESLSCKGTSGIHHTLVILEHLSDNELAIWAHI